MTVHVAVAEPHVAVIVAVPAATPVTVPVTLFVPLPETVATLELLVDHVTLPDAVAVKVPVLPAVTDNVDLFNVTESDVVAAVYSYNDRAPPVDEE